MLNLLSMYKLTKENFCEISHVFYFFGVFASFKLSNEKQYTSGDGRQASSSGINSLQQRSKEKFTARPQLNLFDSTQIQF